MSEAESLNGLPGPVLHQLSKDALVQEILRLRQHDQLLQAADKCRNLIDQTEDGIVCACHVVLPDRRLDRQPWVEIRAVQMLDEDLQEQIECTWPDVEFEIMYVDEDDL